MFCGNARQHAACQPTLLFGTQEYANGYDFNDKNKKGMQISIPLCKKSNQTNKHTGTLIRVLRVSF